MRMARRVGPVHVLSWMAGGCAGSNSGENLSNLRLPPVCGHVCRDVLGVVAVLRGHGLRLMGDRKRNGQDGTSRGRAEEAGVFQGRRAALGRSEIKGHRSPGSSGQITDGVTHKGNSRSVTERRQLPLRHG